MCPEETNKQTKSNGGYGVITLFDGFSSVVPTLTKKFGYAPTVAILTENDIDIRAVVCAELEIGLMSSGALPHKELLPFMSKMYIR